MDQRVKFQFQRGDAALFEENGQQWPVTIVRLKVRTITALQQLPSYVVETVRGDRFVVLERDLKPR